MRSALVLAAALAGCSTPKPEADPAKVEALAKAISANPPPLAGMRACETADHAHPSMTMRTVLELAKEPISDDNPERATWINPPAIDAPAARAVLEATGDKLRRQAAAELLAAKAYMVYRVDMVNAPLALEFKELKRGLIGVRAVGYSRAGDPVCSSHYIVQNDQAVSDSAIKRSNKARVDPAIAKELRDDLAAQLLARIAQLRAGS